MRRLPVGRRGALLDLSDADAGEPAAVAVAVRRLADRQGVVLDDVVPGAETLLVLAADPGGLERLLAALPELPKLPELPEPGGDAAASAHGPGPVVELPVRYDGPDLEGVAKAVGLSVEEVVHRHRSATYRAAFTGFAPGFAYLAGLDPALRLPRRDTPRPAVPAGSLAIADAYTAVYPRRSPGGWHLLGTVDTMEGSVFDLARDPPALISPGQRVRFIEMRS